jgi:hypothetical protein
MLVRNCFAAICLIATGLHAETSPRTCRAAVFEGDVKAGQAFERKLGNGLKLMLDPLPSGWIIRVLPAAGPRGEHDYAELATPPYESVNPLLISTDFSFRAQDAVGWNPRRFRFASSAAAFAQLYQAYRRYVGPGPHAFGQAASGASPASEQELARRIAEAASGTLQIFDAGLIGGTADQWKTAATVASHFSTTAHVEEQPSSGAPTPLGKITWMKFRITLELPLGFPVAPGLTVKGVPCENR